MSRADTVFQESFLSELQRLENGGEVEGPSAVDKLASAIGLEDAPANETEVTYDGMLAKLADRATPETRGAAAANFYRQQNPTKAGPKADDSRAYQAALARKAMPTEARFGEGKGATMGDRLRGLGARTSHFAATNKKPLLYGAGAAAALGGGYAAYRALKSKKKDED